MTYLISEGEFERMRVDPVDGHLKSTRDNGTPVDFGPVTGEQVTDAQMAAQVSDDGSLTVAEMRSKFARRVAVNVRDFGAVCDGIADDTSAVTEFFTFLANNGGVGIVEGIMRLTATVSVLDPAQPFTVRSEGGVGAAQFVSAKAAIGNVFTFRGLKDTLLEGFSVDGVSASTTTHGISAYNCQNTTISDVSVEHYAGTAILFFKHTGFAGDSVGNRMVRCSAVGGGVAANGLLIEHSTGSGMYDCAVSGVDPAANPGYGLQLKNDCVDCVIQGGSVDGAFAGVAFGYDSAAAGNQTNNVVTGVVVRNTVHGFLGSRATSNYVQMVVDMGGVASSLSAARLAGSFSGNYVDMGALNPHATSTILTVQEDNNLVTIPYVNALGSAKLVDFASTASTNTVNVGVIGDRSRFNVTTVPITDAGTSNAVNLRMHSELHATANTGLSLLRFTSPSDQGSYIQLSRTANAYTFRAVGSDVLYLTSTLVAPGATNTQALGGSTRQFTEAWLRDGVVVRSPNGTAYRIRVSDAGAITVTAA